jgi:putative flippase GtrA
MSAALKFCLVGLVGFGVQLTALGLLTSVAGWSWLPATIAAVELAIVHNYCWHRAWTWSERDGSLWKFNLSTAVTSIAGNVVLMALLVGQVGMPVVAANAVAVGIMSAVNFLLADRWVFLAALLILLTPGTAAAGPPAETLAAWNRYVAIEEARIDHDTGSITISGAEGETTDIGGGTVSRWRGSVFIRGLTLDQLLHRLQYPGTPPPQEDVSQSRLLARIPDGLRVYVRLVRHAIVTVSYHTEHEMRFRRLSPTTATARSVATRIEEVGGGDKGFLWRMNSYWRYVETDGGVAVSLESLTLSRDVPMLIKPLAGRIIPRIARESIIRTLDALKRYAEHA